MTKKLSLEQRASGQDLVSIVKSLQVDPPGQTGPELKKLLKLLEKDSCPIGLLMWAALYGSIQMKQVVAKNRASNQSVRNALMLDSESASFYVMDLLQQEEVFQQFVTDIYGDENPFPDVSNLVELIVETFSIYNENHWKTFIPTSGYCDIMQAELVRIIWRLATINNYMNAYQLRYEDQMFVVLNIAIDSCSGFSQFSKNVLRAFLRWSQMLHRSREEGVPSYNYERFDTVYLVVDIYLRRHTEPVNFDKNFFYKGS